MLVGDELVLRRGSLAEVYIKKLKMQVGDELVNLCLVVSHSSREWKSACSD